MRSLNPKLRLENDVDLPIFCTLEEVGLVSSYRKVLLRQGGELKGVRLGETRGNRSTGRGGVGSRFTETYRTYMESKESERSMSGKGVLDIVSWVRNSSSTQGYSQPPQGILLLRCRVKTGSRPAPSSSFDRRPGMCRRTG